MCLYLFSVQDFRLKYENTENVRCNREHTTKLMTTVLSGVVEHCVGSSNTDA